jgi:perosamine synthetase
LIQEPNIGSVVGAEEIEALRALLTARNDSLSWGPEIEQFEHEFARLFGAEHAIAVSSGTAALDLCAQALQFGPGDEIVATPFTFWSTISAQVARGVRVRFADVDPTTMNIDPATIESRITPRTRAIYLVHYGGNPADLDAVRAIAQAHGLPIMEDCCHSPGAVAQGQPIGGGDLCCFSFHSYKNMTTLGEGGMVTTRDPLLAKRIRELRSIGVLAQGEGREVAAFGPYAKPEFELNDHSKGSWDVDIVRVEQIGSNFRMTAPAAAVGLVQLRKLAAFNAARRSVAERYDDALSALGLRPVRVRPGDRSAWHLYSCFLPAELGIDRNRLLAFLRERHGISVVLRYWPLHLNSVMRSRGHAFGEAPVCERLWFEEHINLPIGPLMSDATVDRIVAAIADGMESCRAPLRRSVPA